MDVFDQALRRATADGHLPGTCVIAADKHGNIIHTSSAGSYVNNHDWQSRLQPQDKTKQTKSSPEATHSSKPFGPDTVCWIASMTKLLTTICVWRCVEKGLLNLDDDVASTVLPELGDIEVLVRMDEDDAGNEHPILRPSTGKITLRSLLTHSSGISYEFMHARLLSWRRWKNRDLRERGLRKSHEDRTEVSRAYRIPLVFDPETSWTYGYGIDWAGLAVERACGMTLEDFMKQHIFGPLGMSDTTFEPAKYPHLLSRLAGMSVRDHDGKLVPQKQTRVTSPIGGVRHAGGGGLAGTASDYIKVLISILKNDGKLLKQQSVNSMFTPQLRDPRHLQKMDANPEASGLAGIIPPGAKVNFGLGGILNLEQLPTGRKAYAMQWGGYPNLFWWINPKDGICGCYFSQLVPSGDEASFDMYKKFETAVNSAYAPQSSKL